MHAYYEASISRRQSSSIGAFSHNPRRRVTLGIGSITPQVCSTCGLFFLCLSSSLPRFFAFLRKKIKIPISQKTAKLHTFCPRENGLVSDSFLRFSFGSLSLIVIIRLGERKKED